MHARHRALIPWIKLQCGESVSNAIESLIAERATARMLTDEEIWNSDEIMATNATAGLMLGTLANVVRAAIHEFARTNEIEVKE